MIMIDIVFLLVGLGSPQTFSCTVTRVHDGDGPLWCAEGPNVRIAGIQAPDFESAEPCRRRRAEYVCSDAAARASQRKVSALVLRRRLTCQALEPSYNRIVARCRLPDGRDLSCAVLAAGAATRWDRYWQRYHLGVCSSAVAPRLLSSTSRDKRVDFPTFQTKATGGRDRHSRTFFLGEVEIPVQHFREGALRDVVTHREGPAAQFVEDDGSRKLRFEAPEEVTHF
jgi:endonuclease YncB( thermonuclease family)